MLRILITILLGLSALADASSVKGYAPAKPFEESGRSVKLAPVANNIDKALKSASAAAPVPVAAQVPAVPILESSKKVYNDESIRRLAAQQQQPIEQQQAPVVPIVKQPVSEPIAVAPAQPIVAVAAPSVPVPVAAPVVAGVQKEPVVPQAPVVAKPEPVVVAVPVAPIVSAPEQPASVAVQAKSEPIAPKNAPVAEPVPAPAKPDELPPQSDRSAPVRNEAPAPASVVVVEQVVPAKPVASVSQPVVVAVQPEVASQVAAVASPAVVASQPQAEPAIYKESALQAKKDDVVPVGEPIEVPAPDPGLVLSEPIDSTTKLLIDLDEHVQKFLPAEDQQQPQAPKDQNLIAGIDYSPPAASAPAPAAAAAAASPADPSGKSSGPLVPYSGAEDPIVPPLPPLDGVEKASANPSASPANPVSGSSSSAASPSATRQGGAQHQNQQQVITQLLDQLDSLQNRIQDTINQLVARRRYVMSALLRPMGTYVRRVRTNLERLQNRVNQLQAAAVSVGGGQNRPGGFVDAAAIETIRRRIDDISKRISDIVNRIRFSLTPTSAPLNSNGRK